MTVLRRLRGYAAQAGAVRAVVRAFVRSRDGAAMFVGGMIVIVAMAGVGIAMTNYAWKEAQWEELRAAARAAVAAAGPLLGGAGGSAQDRANISEAVASFTGALLPGLTVGADDVTVSHDAAADITTITVRGSYEFSTFGVSTGDDTETTSIVVKSRLEWDRYEVALAVDVSSSMGRVIVDGGQTTKIEGVRAAASNVIDVMAEVNGTTPGSILMSVVPFATAVNVADTCNPDPDTNTGTCRADRSPGKERYVRMLAGVSDDMATTLTNARTARTNETGGHWVDIYHHYGVGTDLGALRHQYLPEALLNNTDWDLRRTDVAIDVSAQIPGMGTWTVDDVDFWNGCVMARWGAYWNTAARPAGWTRSGAGNWPATKAVAAWTDASTALPATTPLHVSDAPPDADAPSTLFTAFSWPDGRIGGNADARVRETAVSLLEPNLTTTTRSGGDNVWDYPYRGGDVFCPTTPITPLTDSPEKLRSATGGLAVTEGYQSSQSSGVGSGQTKRDATYMSLGMVWALRTVSPLWEKVWDVRDTRNVARPGVPCAPGEAQAGCDGRLTKSILIVSDGTSTQARVRNAQMANPHAEYFGSKFSPEGWVEEARCASVGSYTTYHAAEVKTVPAEFNAYFRTPHVGQDLVGGDDRFNTYGLQQVVNELIQIDDPGPVSAARRNTMATALATAAAGDVAPTPWQLFKGADEDVIEALVATANEFKLDGRPTVIGTRCRPSSLFTPYGRAGDLLYMGPAEDETSPAPVPIAGKAPFELASLPAATVGDGTPGSGGGIPLQVELRERANGWFLAACAVAGLRRVRVNAVFIGNSFGDPVGIATLESCVDAAGGDPNVSEVYVTPTADDLKDVFEELFTVRRNLRFLN